MTVEVDRLRNLLDQLGNRINSLENGSRQSQLPFSSVDTTVGRGYIPFVNEHGEEGITIGRRPDGSITVHHPTSTHLPVVPNDPVLEPLMAGVQVSCTGFVESQYDDFSHVNVYCDNVRVGTIIKVPGIFIVSPLDYTPHAFQLSSVNLAGDESTRTVVVNATPNKVVGDDVLDGIIDELKLADEAVTAAKVAAAAITETKIADDSISTQKIIAQAITSVLLAAESVSADKIAANAVTADKIAALTITANQIAANAITAGKIQAGSVTADKLAAQIILATVAFIAGDPIADRLVIDSTGLNQYDENGQLKLSIGANPNAGNFFTVPDTDGTTLSALDKDGVLSVRGFKLTDGNKDKSTINGINLFEVLEEKSTGAIARCYHPNSGGNVLPTTTTQIGLVELYAYLEPNRSYRVSTNTLYNTASDSTTEAELQLHVRYNSGTPLRPVLASSVIATSGRARGLGAPMRIDHPIFINSTDGGYYFFLISLSRNSGSVLVGVGGEVQFYVEDNGPVPPITGGKANGTGTDTANPQQYITTYTPSWIRWWNPFDIYVDSTTIVYGNNGEEANYFRSMVGFNSTQIQSDLNGASVLRMEVGLCALYARDISGTTNAIMGYHDWSGAPTTFQQLNANIHLLSVKKDVWAWVTLDNPAFGIDLVAQLKTGAIKGFTFDSSMYGADPIHYGELYTTGPNAFKFRITYVK